jgi:hypothetical protein
MNETNDDGLICSIRAVARGEAIFGPAITTRALAFSSGHEKRGSALRTRDDHMNANEPVHLDRFVCVSVFA